MFPWLAYFSGRMAWLSYVDVYVVPLLTRALSRPRRGSILGTRWVYTAVYPDCPFCTNRGPNQFYISETSCLKSSSLQSQPAIWKGGCMVSLLYRCYRLPAYGILFYCLLAQCQILVFDWLAPDTPFRNPVTTPGNLVSCKPDGYMALGRLQRRLVHEHYVPGDIP